MITAPIHPAERLGYTLATHPRLRRTLAYFSVTHLLSLWALIAAPHAAAATMATALNWTGIVDSHNVPVGAYFFSVVNMLEALTQSGPDVSLNPVSWAAWISHATVTAVGHDAVASVIQGMASLYVLGMVIMLWLLRFALSSVWLYWLTIWARPIFEVIRAFLVSHMFYPACLAIGVGVGAWQMIAKHRTGRGLGIIIGAFAIATIGMAFLNDPIGDLYSDHGMIAQSRGLAFGVAQAALHNGPIAAGGTSGQLNQLTAVLADAMIRQPLQLWNFGMVVDDIGTCGTAWSESILAGARTGRPELPAHAMETCGAPQALHYVQNLDASIIGLGVGYWVLGLLFAAFIGYATVSYVLVLIAAFINAILLLIAAGFAMIPGPSRATARRRLSEAVRHLGYVFAYVLYICLFAVLLMQTVSPGGFADQVNMTAPLAKLVLIAILSAAATAGLWWMKKALGDHSRQDAIAAAQNINQGIRRGYRRGKNTLDRGRDRVEAFRGDRRRQSEGDSDPHSTDEPLTTPPVQGRPAAGKPHTPRPATERIDPPNAPPALKAPAPVTPPARAATSTPTGTAGRHAGSARAALAGRGAAGAASSGSSTAAATTAAEAGATLLAPEIVVPVAVAAATRRNRAHKTPTTGEAAPAPVGSQSAAATRTSTPSTEPRPQRRGDRAVTDAPAESPPPQRAPDNPDPGPVAGRH